MHYPKENNPYFTPEHQRQAIAAMCRLNWKDLTEDADQDAGIARAFHAVVVDFTEDHAKFKDSLLAAIDSNFNGSASVFIKSEAKHEKTDLTPCQWPHVHLLIVTPGHYSTSDLFLDLLRWCAIYHQRNRNYFPPYLLNNAVFASGVYHLNPGQKTPADLLSYLAKPTPSVGNLICRHFQLRRWNLHATK